MLGPKHKSQSCTCPCPLVLCPDGRQGRRLGRGGTLEGQQSREGRAQVYFMSGLSWLALASRVQGEGVSAISSGSKCCAQSFSTSHTLVLGESEA
jgi:hypothetical protein